VVRDLPRDRDQGLGRDLPFLDRMLGFRKLGDMGASVLQGDKLPTTGERYRILEVPAPSVVGDP
jgi:hypothetical protein